MRTLLQLLLIGVFLVALLADASAKRKKHRSRTTTEPAIQEEPMDMMERNKLAEMNAENFEYSREDENDWTASKKQRYFEIDPCVNKHCSAGRVCKATEDGVAECVCVEFCAEEVDSRRKVCTKHNETFNSDCEMHQARCFCETGDARCRDPKFEHVHIKYYGECRQMPKCKEEEMMDFPRRMRDWLFNIMRDLADRQELSSHYLKMQREAETNLTLRWTNAAIWKWCDLNRDSRDRSVSRHELFPIEGHLIALEHCIEPFFDSCDTNGDHAITLYEWGKCLKIEEDDIDEKCDELTETKSNL